MVMPGEELYGILPAPEEAPDGGNAASGDTSSTEAPATSDPGAGGG
jgi:hypothetical protein